MQGKMLGYILSEQGLINEAQLSHALEVSKQTNCRLGDVLVSMGTIGYPAVYQAVATHHQLPFVDLLRAPPEPELLEEVDIDLYMSMYTLPWKRVGETVLLATSELNGDVVNWARAKFGDSVRFVITSPLDIRRAVEGHFAEQLTEKSRLSLFHKTPHLSAHTTLPIKQRIIAIMLALFFIISCILAPKAALLGLVAVCHGIFAATMLFKIAIYGVGLKQPKKINWETEIKNLDEKTLPVYSVLVPMYREAESLPHMLASMQAMDYPRAKLDIKLVLEEDDGETLAAAYAHKPSYQFDIIRVPNSKPRTKPKACNYALRFCRGEYVTVYDADDRPAPDQLKKAIITFRKANENVVCVQARLGYYNRNDNWLTRCFSLEYAMLFYVWLTGLERLSVPIPLGGTSNHLALSKLKMLGEWDPFNVTEDADLGTRLCARGYTTQMLDSDTWEEAPNETMAWLNQRTRWIKGYMQTWLVHMRQPIALYRALDVRGFVGFQFFVGLSTFSFLAAPLVWAVVIAWWFGLAPSLPQWLAVFAVLNLILSIIGQIGCTLHTAVKFSKPTPSLILCAITYPVYLWLHSIASYKALWQLIVKPHIWNKTTHGRAKTFTKEFA